MIDLTNQMMYRISNLNSVSERISYQMSTGKVLENGSDDSVVFTRYIDIETKLRDQEGVKAQIDKTISQNNVSDDNINEVKTTIDALRQEVLKSLNAGMTTSDMLSVATNMEGMRSNLIRIANTSVDGEHLYAGSNTTIQPYVKDDDFVVNGRIDFMGNAHLRNVSVSGNEYRERGITAVDVLMYNTDTSADGTIEFKDREKVYDQLGYEWRFLEEGDADFVNDGTSIVRDVNTYDLVYDQGSDTFYRSKVDMNNVDLSGIDYTDTNNWEAFNPKDQIFKINQDNSISYDYLNVSSDGNDPVTYTSESLSDAALNGNVTNNTSKGLLLETKHNFFDDLNIVINALKGYSTQETDGDSYGEQGDPIEYTEIKDLLSAFTGKMDSQYDATNIGHSELGGRNKIFETYQETVSAKITHYNILMQEVNGADLSKLAMESKSLEMTYTALFSTVAKMNELSLVNFIR